MSLELKYDKIVFAVRQADNVTETVVEGSLTLPQDAPEIGRALRLHAAPRVTRVDVKDDQVVFEGTCDLSLLYTHFEQVSHARDDFSDDEDTADVTDEPEITVEEHLHRVKWADELPFAVVLDLPGVREGEEVERSVRVSACSLDVRSDQVTVDVDVAVSLRAWVDTFHEAILATDASGLEDVEIEARDIRVRNVLAKGGGDCSSQGSLHFTGRPSPHQVLELQAVPEIAEVSVEDGSVHIKGYVDYDLVYVGVDDAGPQHARWPRGATFEADISVEGARRGAGAEVEVRSDESRYTIVDDDEGKRIDVTTPIHLDIHVVQVRRLPLITSLSSEEREVAVRLESSKLVEAVGEGHVTETAEASLDLPEDSPAIERVLNGEARVVVEDVHVLGDRVAIEVRADVDMLYVGRDEGAGGVYSGTWPGAFTLDIEIPVPGAEPGLERVVDVTARRVEFDPINRSAVDVRLELVARATLQREVDVEAVREAVEIPGAEANPPTYTFVILEPGDTLWKIAAKYRSDVDAMTTVNPWLDEETVDALPAGRKLCVPRRKSAVSS